MAPHPPDIEHGSKEAFGGDEEHEALLASDEQERQPEEQAPTKKRASSGRQYALRHVIMSFAFGGCAVAFTQYALRPDCLPFSLIHDKAQSTANLVALGEAGRTEVHNFPPIAPTNAFPSLFPTNIGFAGPTPTGAEPALVVTAPVQPLHTGAAQLVVPAAPLQTGTGDKNKDKGKKGDFNILKLWGSLSPWYSVARGAFGVDSGPEVPETCRVTGMHLLHRHGARYPTGGPDYASPAGFSSRLHGQEWETSGDLDFMNDWTFKLGEEVLTPFGRQQLFDLGISMRMKYGFLLRNFTDTNQIPVFRTESQHRMLHSALNFATGFFGLPLEGSYQQSVVIEEVNYNSTFSPYMTCPNSANPRRGRHLAYTKVVQWTEIYLASARDRLGAQMKGFELSVEDVYAMQHLCAFETVAIGYSKFCELFTEDEWEGFNYSWDLRLWYDASFGYPLAKPLGIGYVQELVARLTETRIPVHNSSTNATLDDNPATFPLGQSLYVDATHEVVVLFVIAALNLTSFAAGGPLPSTHIPENRTFRSAELAPFATNVQFQLLSCESVPDPQIRVIINDGVAPLTGIRGCPDQKDGMCPISTFVQAQKEIIAETDWAYGCHGNWTIPDGWNTTTGHPPKEFDT